MSLPVICVCGGGVMARGIIKNLMQKSYPLRLFNRTYEHISDFGGSGVFIAGSAAEAASGADFIISSVADDDASREIWNGTTGVLAGVRAGALAIETSTLSLDWIEEWVKTITSHNLLPIDCPVTGSRIGAEKGTLFAFIGASTHSLKKAMPVLKSFCSDFHHFGKPGNGMRFKLVYNLVGAGIGAVFAEGISLGEHLGIDSKELLDVFKQVGWGSPVACSKGDAMVSRKHDVVDYKMKLFHKDVRYALASAKNSSCPFKVSKLVELLYGSLTLSPLGDQDISAIREAIQIK